MSISESVNVQDENRNKEIQTGNRRIEQVWSGLGWGLLLILIGSLFFAQNKGWIENGWAYFAIGLGAIFRGRR